MLLAAQSAKTIEIPDDIVMSPTYATDAAALVLDLIHMQAPYGLYHGSNAGACSWCEFAQAIFDLSGADCRAIPRSGEADMLRRPPYSAMKSEKLATLGLATRPWREGLAAYLVERSAGSQSSRR
jgi:dTDP-4-dehydrorhamnose reductase